VRARRLGLVLVSTVWLVACSAAAPETAEPQVRVSTTRVSTPAAAAYPFTPRDPNGEGPYDWLANGGPEARAWVDAQQGFFMRQLRDSDGAGAIQLDLAHAIETVWEDPVYRPSEDGGRYFHAHRLGDGIEVAWQKGVNGAPRSIAPGGGGAIEAWAPSNDGALVALVVRDDEGKRKLIVQGVEDNLGPLDLGEALSWSPVWTSGTTIVFGRPFKDPKMPERVASKNEIVQIAFKDSKNDKDRLGRPVPRQIKKSDVAPDSLLKVEPAADVRFYAGKAGLLACVAHVGGTSAAPSMDLYVGAVQGKRGAKVERVTNTTAYQAYGPAAFFDTDVRILATGKDKDVVLSIDFAKATATDKGGYPTDVVLTDLGATADGYIVSYSKGLVPYLWASSSREQPPCGTDVGAFNLVHGLESVRSEDKDAAILAYAVCTKGSPAGGSVIGSTSLSKSCQLVATANASRGVARVDLPTMVTSFTTRDVASIPFAVGVAAWRAHGGDFAAIADGGARLNEVNKSCASRGGSAVLLTGRLFADYASNGDVRTKLDKCAPRIAGLCDSDMFAVEGAEDCLSLLQKVPNVSPPAGTVIFEGPSDDVRVRTIVAAWQRARATSDAGDAAAGRILMRVDDNAVMARADILSYLIQQATRPAQGGAAPPSPSATSSSAPGASGTAPPGASSLTSPSQPAAPTAVPKSRR
jgi:hypothetical protein